MIRTELGATWEEFIQTWCVGITPQPPKDQVILGLETLNRLWTQKIDDLISKQARGIAVIDPLVHLGLKLQSCEHLSGFTEILNRMKQDDRSAISEITLANLLLNLGFQPALEPFLQNNRPDCSIHLDGKEIFFEVIAPEQAEIYTNNQRLLNDFAQFLLRENLGLNIEIQLDTLITELDIQTILNSLKAMPISPQIQKINNIALVLKEEVNDKSKGLSRIPSLPKTSYQTIKSVTVKNNQLLAAVAIKSAAHDNRILKLISKELHHFSKETINILAVNVSAIIGGITYWETVIQRCFQPKRNTRLGAIILYHENFSVENMIVRSQGKILRNPYATNPPPESLLISLENILRDGV